MGYEMKERNVMVSKSSVKKRPNPVLVARQIENLREILRRMRASARTTALDPIINSKLEQLAHN
jgi:hypothetical protein